MMPQGTVGEKTDLNSILVKSLKDSLSKWINLTGLLHGLVMRMK